MALKHDHARYEMIAHTHIYQHILEKFLLPEKTPRKEKYTHKTNYVLAVSGAAASGKTTFCKGMVEYLKKKGQSAVHVPLDGYLLDRETRNKKKLSGYDPKSSDIPRMIDDMKTLIYEGKSINLPIYDHKSGNHRLSRRIEPAEVIILDGIMSLQFEIRERFPNLNIFFTSDDIVIRSLRIMVDMEERGYSVIQALANSDEEFVFYNKWIYPQITFAHIKIWVGEQRELRLELN